jgi:hypothetical protein
MPTIGTACCTHFISIRLPAMLSILITKERKNKEFVVYNSVLLSDVADFCVSTMQLQILFGNLHTEDGGQCALQA